MRVRVRFSKLGKVRFTSHRDVARIWERVFRKAALPVAYSEGFSPRPKLAFGLALPTGAESLAEYVDIELVEERPLAGLAPLLTDAMPTGFTVHVVAPVDRSATSLQEDVEACTWEITVRDLAAETVVAAVERALAADTLPLARERKGELRVDDLRPGIESLSVDTSGVAPTMRAVLATRPRGMRPGELLAVCFPDVARPGDLAGRLLRTHQWIERDGARRELLPLAGAGAPHTRTVVCA
ncbi:MAG: TIGR03936 family radical SAM-associated protein [Acidimicrobiia bacterium]